MSDSQVLPRNNSKLNSDTAEHQHRPFGKMAYMHPPFTAKILPIGTSHLRMSKKKFRAANLVLRGAPMKKINKPSCKANATRRVSWEGHRIHIGLYL